MRRARAGYSYSNSVVYSCSTAAVQQSNRLTEKVSLLFDALTPFAVVVSPPSPIVMSTASSAASTSSVITVSSGAGGSSAAPTSTAASAPPGASSSSPGLYSQLLRSLDDSTRRQSRPQWLGPSSPRLPLSQPSQARHQVCNHMLSLCRSRTLELVCSKHPPCYQFVLHPLPLPFAASPTSP